MKKPNKTELEYFIRYSLDSDKYKRYMELYDEIERLKEENEYLKQKLLIYKHTKMLLMCSFGMRGSGKSAYEKLKEFDRLLNKAIIIKQEDNYILCNMAKQELYEMIYKYREEFLFKDED